MWHSARMRGLLFTVGLSVAAAAAAAGEAVEVGIDRMQFEPAHLKIKPGTTVRWVNKERRNNHSILFEQGGLPESERLFPGDAWEHVFDKPGRYPYTCEPHPEMKGVIEVAD